MGHTTRLAMNTALKNVVVPHLREHGFKGSLPHFRRKQQTHIDLITFQFNRYGGSFVVELTTCPVEGVLNCWGEQIPFNKLIAHDVNTRYRLTTGTTATDKWFDYETCTNDQQFEVVAYAVKQLLHIHEPNWIPKLLLQQEQ